MKNFIVGALIIGVAIIFGCMLIKSAVINYGASPGPEHYDIEYFYSDLLEGGEITTISDTETSTTPTAAQFCDSGVIQWAPSVEVNATLTTPTAAAISAYCMPKEVLTKTFVYKNTTSTASTTWVAGTGVILTEPQGQDVIIGGGNKAFITMIQGATSGYMIINVDEWIDAD